MAIDSKRCTGNQCTEVFVGNCQKKVGFIRQNGIDLRNLIGQGFSKNVEIEHVPKDKLIEIGEQPHTGDPGVSGQNGVGARAADGKRAANQVTDAFL